jgi:translation initiation factor 1
MSRRGDATVYSTEQGRICPRCGMATKRCVCRSNPRKQDRQPEGDGSVRIRRETKGRKGKTVTTVTGVPLAEPELRDLAKELKQLCGTGGSLKDSVIEIQGDHRDKIAAALREKNLAVKLAGG